MFCPKCGKEIANGICPFCGNNSTHRSIIKNLNYKTTIPKITLTLLSVISLFWIMGSITMFVNSDQSTSDRIYGGILFLFLAIIFIIPFFILLNKYLKNTKANRMTNKTQKKLMQEEQMQLKYKEILEHKEKISTLEAENQAKEEYIDTINKDKFFEKVKGKQHEDIEQHNLNYDSIGSYNQKQINPADILLLKIDSISTSGVYFENIACHLLEANGFENIRNTPASGDYGIDILAEKDGISYAIQCKCYSNKIGNKAVQEAFSGKQFYNCMVAVVLTNSHFTKSAIETAKATNVLLWDREKLIQMIDIINDTDLQKLTNISVI